MAKKNDAKKVFRKQRTCSRTLFYLLNREFGHMKENEEKAADPLAGGIIQQGYQCGMLWGATMAAGAESFRRYDDTNTAIGYAIKASQEILKSFTNRTKSPDCGDITQCNWSRKLSTVKYIITGKFLICFQLSEDWMEEAIEAAKNGLTKNSAEMPSKCKSCASEAVKKMGGTKEEQTIVAGLAGGIGLSGNGCGALAAAMWKKTLDFYNNNPGKKLPLVNPETKELQEKFYKETDYKILCTEVSERNYNSIKDHTNYLEEGGCKNIIEVLSNT
jgi:hypothetical protein